jgi:hypothetical protein
VREAMLSKLEGLSEYDIRRPLTLPLPPTGAVASLRPSCDNPHQEVLA